MTETDHKPDVSRQVSPILRLVFIVVVAVLILAIGHLALRLSLSPERGGASAPAPMEFGEKAGGDAAGLPRPPKSERLFAMTSRGRPQRIIVRYASGADEQEVVRFYRDTMPALGWVERKGAPPDAAAYSGAMLWYSNPDGNWCMIAISQGEQGGAYVTVMRMPNAVVTR